MIRGRFWAWASLLLIAACQDQTPSDNSSLSARALPGGHATHINLNPLGDRSADAFSQPAANLPLADRGRFALGNSFFTSPWVSAPASTRARDGLGPLFDAAACQDCHVRDGRGHAPPGPDQALTAAVIRLAGPQGTPDPTYGAQLQTHAVAGLAPEARVRVLWQTHTVTLPDGVEVELRSPRLELSNLSDGALASETRAGLRIAPPMIGLGLLEAIAADDLRAKSGDDAIAGRLREVADLASGSRSLGRFGWKAAQPSVRQQSLAALVEDMGITSTLFPQDNCSPAQHSCRALPHGGAPELEPAIEDGLVFYTRHLAVPARRDAERPEVREGEALFAQIGCTGCHRPQWKTASVADAPALSNQHIWPYTDLRLHDMGPGLDDGVAEAGVPSRFWRTPPLWGLGHTATVGGPHAGYLHDGRARTVTEAILWHGGEAQAARDAWAALPDTQRRRGLRFLGSN